MSEIMRRTWNELNVKYLKQQQFFCFFLKIVCGNTMRVVPAGEELMHIQDNEVNTSGIAESFVLYVCQTHN